MKRKIALITGGAQGIGKSIVLKLSMDGYNIVINDIKTNLECQGTIKEAESNGATVMFVQADVSTREGCKALVDKAISKFSKIDVLVNNAGTSGSPAEIWNFPEDEFERIMYNNVFSQFYMIKYVTKHMITNPQGGTVINISSVSAIEGVEAFAGYVTSKGASMALIKTVARDLAPYNINCNAIAPGVMNTEMILTLPQSEQERLKNTISMKRFGNPSEVGSMVAFLASEGARYVTGQTLVVDGICKM